MGEQALEAATSGEVGGFSIVSATSAKLLALAIRLHVAEVAGQDHCVISPQSSRFTYRSLSVT